MSRRGDGPDADWTESARRLMGHLDGGGSLVPETPDLRLGSGETQYAHLRVHCSRYLSAPRHHHSRTTMLGFGSLETLTLTALGSAMWNSHKRRQAESAAVAQWRPLGWLDVVVTSSRLLVLEELAWRSVWLGRIVQVIPQLERDQLDVLFEEFPALRLNGASVPYLGVMLRHLLDGAERDVFGQDLPGRPRRMDPLESGRCL
jgi:hypothetical protein